MVMPDGSLLAGGYLTVVENGGITSATQAGAASPSISMVISLISCRPPPRSPSTAGSFCRACTRLPSGTMLVKRTRSDP